MTKRILRFSSLETLALFSQKHLCSGYSINTTMLTVSARMPDHVLFVAVGGYGADEVDSF